MQKETFKFEGAGKDGVRYTTKRTIVEFMLRLHAGSASIVKVYGIMEGRFREGVKKEVIEIIEQFKKDYPQAVSIFCQSSREQEIVMLYDAGLRMGVWGTHNYLLADHLGLFVKSGSICMVWMAPSKVQTVDIMELNTDGDYKELATYTLEPKKALISFIQGEVLSNRNTYRYPEHMEGIYLLAVSGRWAYELPNGSILIAKPASEAK